MSVTSLPDVETPAVPRSEEDIPESVVLRLDPVVLKVFSQGDFHRVDMRTIAKEAGMSFTTIYRYFKDKETLLFWFISYWLKELEEQALAALAPDQGTAFERLKKCLVAHFHYYQTHPEVGRIVFMTVPLERWMRDSTYQYSATMRRLLKVTVEGQQAGELRSDVPPTMVLDMIAGLFNRMFLMWEYRGRVDSLAANAEAYFDMLANGVRQPR